MIKRRKHIEVEPEHHERWMVSYADFITLLFAFFVVMYAISSVNKSKYETFSESLDQALNTHIENESVEAIKIKQLPTTIQPIQLPNLITSDERQLSDEIIKEKKSLSNVGDKFQEELQGYIDNNLVSIKKHDFWIELEMNSELLFGIGKADLSLKAQLVLAKVAELVRDVPNVINVEGYTDDIPISNGFFPSNWDLSSARATSVVKELVKNNIAPIRLSAVGYGEFHPIGDNKDEEGRFKNRRVVLVLMSQAFSRYGMSDDERAKVLNLSPKENQNDIEKPVVTPTSVIQSSPLAKP